MKQIKELKQRLQQEFKNPQHNFITRSPFIALTDEILLMTKNEKADLVIMGTQGATSLKEVLFGTNTTQVIRRTTCPVIAVPSGFEYKSPQAILFPTDYEIDYEKKQLQQLLDISKKHDSIIDVIHLSSDYDLADDQLRNKQKLKAIIVQGGPIFNDLPDQGVIEAINQFQTSKEIDLLVLVRNKHTFLERLFIVPVIKKVGFSVNIPFMVISYFD